MSPHRETLKKRLQKGGIPLFLLGCPEGGWPETAQARREILDALPARTARAYSVQNYIDAVYSIDGAGRYVLREEKA